MRYDQIKPTLNEEILDEVKMSPSALQKFARSPEAEGMLMGIEFEMCVPDVTAGDDEPMWEFDYDQDERARSIQDIIEFFRNGEFSNMGRSSADRLQSELEEQFWEWQTNAISDNVDSDELNDRIRDKLLEDLDWEDYVDQAEEELTAAGEMPDDADDTDARSQAINMKAKDLLRDAVDDMITNRDGREYEDAYDEIRPEMEDEMRDDGDYDEEAWLNDIGVETMQDAEREWSLDWPHMYDANEGNSGSADISYVADEFAQAMGVSKVNTSDGYHGALRDGVNWIIEPDGSIDADSRDAGLEFVSPPQPIAQGLETIQKMYKWAKDNKCYTNDSTGLHMNISVPDLTVDKLDYVKLALFLGDEYVLKQFGREYNTYCKSAMSKIRDRIRPEEVSHVLAQMKEHLNSLASKTIHKGITEKYTSINTKRNYVEFRGPGGDYLDQDPMDLVNTALRAAMALRIASNPEAYKQEYAKKLYKLVEQAPETDDTVNLFSQFALGELPKEELVARVKFAQRGRNIAKGKRDTVTRMLNDPRVKQQIQDLSPRWRDLLTNNLQSENEQGLQSTINTIEAGEYDDELTSEDRNLIISVIKNELAVRQTEGEKKQYWVSKRNGGYGQQMVYAHNENEAILLGGKNIGLNREQSISQLQAVERVDRNTEQMLASLPDDWREFYDKVGDASMGVLRGGLDSMTTGRWQYRNLDDEQVGFIKRGIENEMRSRQDQGEGRLDRKHYPYELRAMLEAMPVVVRDWLLNIPNKSEEILRDAYTAVQNRTWGRHLDVTQEQLNIAFNLINDELVYRRATGTEQEDGTIQLQFKDGEGTVDGNETRWKVTITSGAESGHDPVFVDADSPRQAKIKAANIIYRETGSNISLDNLDAIATTQDDQGTNDGTDDAVLSTLPEIFRHWLSNIGDHSDIGIINTLNNPRTYTDLTDQQAAYFRIRIKRELRSRGINPDEQAAQPQQTANTWWTVGSRNYEHETIQANSRDEAIQAYAHRNSINVADLTSDQLFVATETDAPLPPSNAWADDAAERERMRREREQLAVDMQAQLVNRDDPVTSNDAEAQSPIAQDGPGLWLVGNHTYGRETLRADSREDAIAKFARNLDILTGEVVGEPGFVVQLVEPAQGELDLREMRRLAGLV